MTAKTRNSEQTENREPATENRSLRGLKHQPGAISLG